MKKTKKELSAVVAEKLHALINLIGSSENIVFGSSTTIETRPINLVKYW